MWSEQDWWDKVFPRDKPPTSGWYATCHCGDPRESVFAGAHYWNGEDWYGNLPIGAFHSAPFARRGDAEAQASAHEPKAS